MDKKKTDKKNQASKIIKLMKDSSGAQSWVSPKARAKVSSHPVIRSLDRDPNRKNKNSPYGWKK